MLIYKKITSLFLLCSFVFIFSSCTESTDVKLPVVEEYDVSTVISDRKKLKVGVVPGPYGDMFREMIAPFLTQDGYEFEIIVYENYEQPNFALANSEVDLNIFQHYRYLNSFKFTYDLDLSAVTEIPTAPMGIFSNRYSSLENLPYGATIAIPSDITNLARALMVLESAGLVRINSTIEKSKATITNLEKNPKNIEFVLLEASQLTGSLDRYDASVINGNYAISSGINLSDSLYNEVLAENYINVIAARTEDLSQEFVDKIIKVSHSDEYKEIFMDSEGKYTGFQWPKSFLDTRGLEDSI